MIPFLWIMRAGFDPTSLMLVYAGVYGVASPLIAATYCIQFGAMPGMDSYLMMLAAVLALQTLAVIYVDRRWTARSVSQLIKVERSGRAS